MLSVSIGFLHFALPFLILLSADIKRHPRRLSVVAILLLVMRWVDLYWQAAPTFSETLTIHWLDLATVVAVGGIWLWLFFNQLSSRPILPLQAPRLQEVIEDD